MTSHSAEQAPQPHPFIAAVTRSIERAAAAQQAALAQSAREVAARVRAGGILHTFGTGHSVLIAEELYGRAGGPTFVNAIFDETLALPGEMAKSTRAERLPGYAAVVLEGAGLREGDAMLIASNSGRNAVPVEAAEYARDRGVYTVGLTSRQHSSAVSSRSPSGRKLMDIVDVVLDNDAVAGDARLELPGTAERYGPTSTVVGAALAQTLICQVIEELAAAGEEPPLLRSANLDGSDAENRRRIARYADRIPGFR